MEIDKIFSLAKEYSSKFLTMGIIEKSTKVTPTPGEIELKPKEGSYVGDNIDGKPHGEGVMTYSDDSFYDG